MIDRAGPPPRKWHNKIVVGALRELGPDGSLDRDSL